MIELPLVFLGGFLGSAHCVGMCGGFACSSAPGRSGFAANLRRQMVYSLGRIFTYAACGATLGYLGLRLADDLAGTVHVQSVLAILAGVLLTVQGLIAAGVLPRAVQAIRFGVRGTAANLAPRPAASGCLAGGMLGPFLRGGRLRDVFLAGMLTGFLPCGLVYAYLALAGSTSDTFGGAATMAAFGTGPIPLMIMTGSGASLLSLAGKQRMLRIAAWCVVLTGLVSLARGFGYLDVPLWHASGSCPMCN